MTEIERLQRLIDSQQETIDQQKRVVRAFQSQGLTLRVAKSGGMSVYGMGRYPVTLYRKHWLMLLDMADTIREFLVEHEAELPLKTESKT